MKDYYVRITVRYMNKLYFGVWRHNFTVICNALASVVLRENGKISKKNNFLSLFRLFLLIPLYLLEILSFVHLIYISKGILTKFRRPMGYINRQISARKNEKQYFFPFFPESANQNRLFGPRDQSFMDCR